MARSSHNTDSSDEEHNDSPYGHPDRRNSDWGSNWAKGSTRTVRGISENWRSAAPEPLAPTPTPWRPRRLLPNNLSEPPKLSPNRSRSASETDLKPQMPAILNVDRSDVAHDNTTPRTNEHRQQSRVHSATELAPGTIIRALHLSEALAPRNADVPDWNVHQQSVKIPWDTNRAIQFKVRYFVTTKVLEGLYQAVPIFTKAFHGLKNVPEREHGNYMALKDHRSPDFECQNPALPVLVTAEMDPDSVLLHPKALVLFNGPCTFWTRHQIEIHGRLTSYSTAVLLQHCFRRYDDEPIGEPSAKMVEDLELKLQAAKIEQQKFKDAVAANPNHGREPKHGNRQHTPSPPTKERPRQATTRRSSASDAPAGPHPQPSRRMGITDATPSPLASRNPYSALNIDEEDEEGEEDEEDDKEDENA
ncbi:hypothetical protein H2200_008325 [Cladophialophora chaetospira]|uniref:Uncharacterized protein n=1 Tax=Cladophialophora chaetospira TaxID=386627 RepID=A0AA38X5M5_9EURO|nr:hypothetical protein H2200_008325 [Cladophialophora chaetospira]